MAEPENPNPTGCPTPPNFDQAPEAPQASQPAASQHAQTDANLAAASQAGPQHQPGGQTASSQVGATGSPYAPQAQTTPGTATVPPPAYGNYAQQFPAQPAQPQPTRKVWPWVLLACLLAFLLGLGGCAGCTAIGLLLGNPPQNRDASLHQYDYGETPYGYGYDYDDDAYSSDTYGGFTIDDIVDAAGNLPGDVDDGKANAGVYVIGRDIDAGSYFLQGMTSQEGNFYVFAPEGSGTFSLKASIVYVGHYFYDFEDGQIVVFKPCGNGLCMIPAGEAEFSPQAPYTSGLYRVGQDIPAGTYTITVSDDAPRETTQDYAAYVMQDLEFNDDSILDTKYLIKGGKQTVTVEDGQLLELYGCTATPEE